MYYRIRNNESFFEIIANMMLNAISLFSSSGIGDLGLRQNNIQTVAACELLPERAGLMQRNFPDTRIFCGNIWELSDDIVGYYETHFKQPPFLILATPPCQGMSSNGMGKMLSDHRKGIRPKLDERNRLIIPTLDIIKRLKPQWILLENVANMMNTVIINEDDNLVNIVEYIEQKLEPLYVGKPEILDCADFGVPQHRKRLISLFSRTKKAKQHFEAARTLIPSQTHSVQQNLCFEKWLSVRDVLSDLPPLSAVKGSNKAVFNSLHRVPVLDEKKMFWIHNTSEGSTAFNNQCINPSCLYRVFGSRYAITLTLGLQNESPFPNLEAVRRPHH